MFSQVYLDVDDTIADFIGGLIQRYNAKHGTHHVREDVIDWEFSTILKPGQSWKDYVDPSYWENLDPLPWAHELVAAVRKRSHCIPAAYHAREDGLLCKTNL